MSKELNCMNCCIGDFKESLCDCNNGMCKEYKKVGRSEDFEKEVLKRTKPKTGDWIPCSERLPEESGTYLTTTAKGSVCIDHFYANSNDICGRHWSYHRRREPIAWMPLPPAYREESD